MATRSAARTAVVWDALPDVLGPAGGRPGPRRSVVDIGGGTGGFAVRVAELGHQVTVVDPSPDALAALARRADETGVAERSPAARATSTTSPTWSPAGSADVVLCHGVLEVVDDPAAALARSAGCCVPAAPLSLLVAQRHAAVVARAMAGHFAAGPGAARRARLAGGSADAAAPSLHRRRDHRAARRGRVRHPARCTAVRVFVRPGAQLAGRPRARCRPGPASSSSARWPPGPPEYLTLATQIHVAGRPPLGRSAGRTGRVTA